MWTETQFQKARNALTEAFLGLTPNTLMLETGIRISQDSTIPITLTYLPQQELNVLLVRWSQMALSNSASGGRSQRDRDSEGIITDSLTSEEKRALETLKVSYLTLSGDLCLFLHNRFLKYARSRPLNLNPRKAGALRNLVRDEQTNNGAMLGLPPYTLFVSPYALDALDVIFRVDEASLKSSTLAFAKRFSLVQSRVARMLKGTGAETPWHLKHTVKKFPTAWWERALTYPRTHQRLNSFYRFSERFVSMLETDVKSAFHEIIHSRSNAEPPRILLGPGEVLKRSGYFHTDELSAWVTQPALRQIKNDLRLVPASLHPSKNSIELAVVSGGFEKQAIVSKVLAAGISRLDAECDRLNFFRVVWDAANHDSRSKEAAMEFLAREVLK
jgi:hypothetical protein